MHIRMLSGLLSSRASSAFIASYTLRVAAAPAAARLPSTAPFAGARIPGGGRGFRAMPPVMMGRRSAKIAGRKVHTVAHPSRPRVYRAAHLQRYALSCQPHPLCVAGQRLL